MARGGAVGLDAFATIERGWHINAHQPKDKFLKPTVLTLKAAEGITVSAINYPVSEKRKFAFSGDSELLVYQGKLGMTSAIHVPADYRGDRILVEGSSSTRPAMTPPVCVRRA